MSAGTLAVSFMQAADLDDALRAACLEVRHLRDEFEEANDAPDGQSRSLAVIDQALQQAKATRHTLALEHVAVSVARLAERYANTVPVLDGNAVEALALLVALESADEDPDRLVFRWLSRQSGPDEAVLLLVANLCLRGRLPLQAGSLFYLAPPEQVRALAQIVNAMGAERLVRASERQLAFLERDLEDRERRARRYERSPVSPSAAAVEQNNEERLTGLPGRIARQRRVQTYLGSLVAPEPPTPEDNSG